MKNFMFLGLTALLFIACKENGPVRYASTSPEIDAVKAHIQAYNDGNWTAWTAVYVDTAKVYHNSLAAATSAEVMQGLKTNLESVSSYNLGGDDPFYEMVIDNDGEKWVNSWMAFKGTLAANGEEITIPVHITYEFVGDKIVKEHAYYNLAEFITMLQKIEASNKMSADEKAIQSTIDNVIKAWNTKDKALLEASTVKNMIRNSNGIKAVNNQTEYGNFMDQYFEAFPDFHVTLDKAIVDGNTAFIYWMVMGTNTGKFMGNPPTDKKIETHGLSVWKFDREGKAIQEDAFSDNLEVYQQLGYSMPAPK
ncbi:MAG: ester cyclase [Maribacter sp.]|nr:ester cyclase [Maribacter sp.]